MKLAIHLFHRDLRLDDNTALREALEQSEAVIPAFIFDDRQIKKHAFRSARGLDFLLESLTDLDTELRRRESQLFIFRGQPHRIIEKLILSHQLQAVFCNRDYTPFSRKRDQEIETVCKKQGVVFHSYNDALLVPPEDIKTASGTPYQVFTSFYNAAQKHPIASPQSCRRKNFYTGRITKTDNLKKLTSELKSQLFKKDSGGRIEGKKLLRQLSRQTSYPTARDLPGLDSTTHLAPHHKFGTISIRETYHALHNQPFNTEVLRKELYWRDFFTHVAWHFPHVFGQSFQKKFQAITWKKPGAEFTHWQNGTTGFPIVDAGMRELRATGFMHNRVRMITASFLIKDLHLDWRLGEQYFASQLTDYDPAVNNGNWQWVAGTGADAAPYFRIFNPWLQQAKFDPDCVYIKKWITELADVDTKTIHNWAKLRPTESRYGAPIIDHKEAIQITKILYQ